MALNRQPQDLNLKKKISSQQALPASVSSFLQSTPNKTKQVTNWADNTNKVEFVNRMKPAAERAAAALNVPVSTVLAHMAFESGWGKSEAAQKLNNFGGIKAFSNWKGDKASLPTFEKDRTEKIMADFRKYPSVDDYVTDYIQKFEERPWPVKGTQNAYDFAMALAPSDKTPGYHQDTPEIYAKQMADTEKSVLGILKELSDRIIETPSHTIQLPENVDQLIPDELPVVPAIHEVLPNNLENLLNSPLITKTSNYRLRPHFGLIDRGPKQMLPTNVVGVPSLTIGLDISPNRNPVQTALQVDRNVPTETLLTPALRAALKSIFHDSNQMLTDNQSSQLKKRVADFRSSAMDLI